MLQVALIASDVVQVVEVLTNLAAFVPVTDCVLGLVTGTLPVFLSTIVYALFEP